MFLLKQEIISNVWGIVKGDKNRVTMNYRMISKMDLKDKILYVYQYSTIRSMIFAENDYFQILLM